MLGKKKFGRKRHLLVDTEGLPLAVHVHAANIQDRDGARLLLTEKPVPLPRMKHVWLDSAYAGKIAEWLTETFGWTVEIIKLRQPHRFQVQPRRWVVERTFSWLSRCRRLSRDFEGLCESSEAFIHLALIRLMLARLSKLTG